MSVSRWLYFFLPLPGEDLGRGAGEAEWLSATRQQSERQSIFTGGWLMFLWREAIRCCEEVGTTATFYSLLRTHILKHKHPFLPLAAALTPTSSPDPKTRVDFYALSCLVSMAVKDSSELVKTERNKNTEIMWWFCTMYCHVCVMYNATFVLLCLFLMNERCSLLRCILFLSWKKRLKSNE